MLSAIGMLAAELAMADPLDIGANRTESTSTNYQGGTWTSGLLTIDDGVTITLDGPLTNTWVITNNVQHQWSSGATPTGKLVNKGTIRVDMLSLWRSNQGGGTIVENFGLIDMVRAGAQIHLDNGSKVFNYTGAVLQASAETGVRGVSPAIGKFINDGGTVRATNSAVLQVQCSSGTPGQFLSGTIDATYGTVRFGSYWSTIVGTAVGGPLKFGNGVLLYAGNDPVTVIDVGGEGTEIDSNANSIHCNNNTLENRSVMRVTGTGQSNLHGSSGGDQDIFHNSGTLIQDKASGEILTSTDTSMIISNSGTWILTNATPIINLRNAGVQFVNTGTLRCDATTSGRMHNGTFKNYGGTVIANGAPFRIELEDGLNESTGGEYIATNGGQMRISGAWSNFNSLVTGGPLYLNGLNRFDAKAPNTTFNILGDEFLDWSAASGGMYLNGNTLTINRFATSGTGTRVIGNGGTVGGFLIVADHFKHDSSSYLDVWECYGFRNEGTWEFLNTTGDKIHLRNSMGVGEFSFSNTVSGIITQGVSGTSSWVGQVLDGGVFVNKGKVVITAGTISWDLRWVIDSQTGGTLDEGTWECLGGGLTFPTDHSNIDTINSNATVRLGSSGGISKLLEASLTTIYGTLGLHSSRTWSNAAGITTDADTRLEFGLDDSGSDAKLTLGDDTMLSGAIDLVDLGDLPFGSYTVIEMSSGKSLTDGGITKGELTTDQAGVRWTLTIITGIGGKVIINFLPIPKGLMYMLR